MTNSPLLSPTRRSAPHIVTPTTRALRDSMLAPPSAQLNEQDNVYGAIDERSDLLKIDRVIGASDYQTEHISFDAANSFRTSWRRPLLIQQWQCVERAA